MVLTGRLCPSEKAFDQMMLLEAVNMSEQSFDGPAAITLCGIRLSLCIWHCREFVRRASMPYSQVVRVIVQLFNDVKR